LKVEPVGPDHDDALDAEPSAVRVRGETEVRNPGFAFHAFIEAIPLPAWIHDVETCTILGANNSLVELIGCSREVLIGSPSLALYDPLDRPAMARRIERLRARPLSPALTHPAPVHLLAHGGRSVAARISSSSVPAISPHARLVVVHDLAEEPRPTEPPGKSDRTARKHAEELIGQGEQRYRTLFEACPVAACVYNVATLELLAVNDAMARQYGYTRDELLSMGIFDLVAPDDSVAMQALLDELERGRLPGVVHHACTVRHRLRGGAEIDVELIAAPLNYGGIEARLVLHNDATDRKRAETDLVKRARIDAFRADLGAAMTADETLPAHFERVVRAMEHHLDLDSVGIWVLDEATGQLHLQASVGTLDVSTAGGRRLAFGETWIGRAAARALPVLLDTWDPSMRPLEVTHAQKFGVTHVAAFPLIVRRRVLGVVSASRASAFPEALADILGATATQLAQGLGTAFAYEALRISESLSRSILANMLSALVTLTDDGIIDSVNGAAESTFGFSRDELTGQPFGVLFDGSSADPRALLAQALGRMTELQGRRKNGERFACELRLFQLDSLRGSGYAAIAHDVSERYEVERLKAEFVSVVSHELRTPLTAVRGSLGLLTGGVLGHLSPAVMELLLIAERNTLRLITLVNDILDLERLQSGEMVLVLKPVRARGIVDRSVESVKSFADQVRVTIAVRCTDDVVRGDGDRLVQVLVNLLSNAVKFSPPESLIEVSTTVEPRTTVFRVSDRGRGVPLSHRRVIFERFQQVHASDANEKGGTGLGLAISKAIVEKHGGTIGVESEEGTGSTFWFRVPRALSE